MIIFFLIRTSIIHVTIYTKKSIKLIHFLFVFVNISINMDDKSFQEKEGLIDNSKRLSESRPIFKPVLVKKLLADVDSDDESDDQAPSSDESEEECDDLEGLQPLSECNENIVSKSVTEKTETNGTIRNKGIAESKSDFGIGKDEIVKKDEVKISNASIKVDDSEKSQLSTYVKDSLKISESIIKQEKKLMSDKSNSAIKRKSYICSGDKDNAIVQMQWQAKIVKAVDQVKHSMAKEETDFNNQYKSYSPEIKRHSASTASQSNEVKETMKSFESYSSVRESQEVHVSCSSSHSKTYNITGSIGSTTSTTQDDKLLVPSQVQVCQTNKSMVSSSQSALNSQKVTETPMKIPQGSTRPNPCNSHRNIFQTPQSKVSLDVSKNPAQTPATIFSHWSQQHMAQTPMNSQSSARETMHTPATNISQAQTSRQTPRYHVGENKSVRRPLADSMFSVSAQGPQLPKLQEFPHESQPSPSVTSRDNISVQDNILEKKSLYKSAQTPCELKENRNPNPHENVRTENYENSQVKLSQSEHRHSIHSKNDMQKVEYANVHQSNMYVPSRSVERQENYQVRESQGVSAPATSQESRPMQRSIPQQIHMFNSRQNKIITVKNNHYLVLGALGHGMSCEVVRAQDLASLEMRAIKCVDLSKMEKETVQGCLQEILMLDKLRAPCIVNMYSFEINGPSLHVVMEIGDTDLSRLLKSMLQEKKQLPLTMILYYWTEMLTAVKHIHDNGVIHSDLKPANFLLVRGRLKLIDFGIASSINADMTSVVKNSTCGTLNYISPEALVDVSAGNPESPSHTKYKLSYKSDIWSLGCILYSLVYNATPFNHIRQTWAKVSAITDPKHKINFPTMTGSQPVPLILIDVMRKCLQRDPKARPTVAELLEISYFQSSSPAVTPNIPSQILFKIKRALSDEEWKQLTEILDKNPKLR
ncbi:probable serine/threonine-protein kinase mps1 [Phymastichus coffea]|uniref:probable serine/threonine-protein kinase mps1 n=1 Tax=Phymastichus coffea TaxID=108790 RepID=UPI00273CE482|nr:probable serine/threonine-protein kinase mps1 [Phymastichus coffea]